MDGKTFKSDASNGWETHSDRKLKDLLRPFEFGVDTILKIIPW